MCGLKILCTLISFALLLVLIVGLCIDAKTTCEVFIAILAIISSGFALCAVIISLINLFLYIGAKFKSMKKLQFLPIDKEEINKLKINTKEQYLDYIKEFLTIKYKHIDIDFYVYNETTSVKIPKFVAEQIINIMIEQLEGSITESIEKYADDPIFGEFF